MTLCTTRALLQSKYLESFWNIAISLKVENKHFLISHHNNVVSLKDQRVITDEYIIVILHGGEGDIQTYASPIVKYIAHKLSNTVEYFNVFGYLINMTFPFQLFVNCYTKKLLFTNTLNYRMINIYSDILFVAYDMTFV